MKYTENNTQIIRSDPYIAANIISYERNGKKKEMENVSCTPFSSLNILQITTLNCDAFQVNG